LSNVKEVSSSDDESDTQSIGSNGSHVSNASAAIDYECSSSDSDGEDPKIPGEMFAYVSRFYFIQF
jgi:hypothetical protein